MKGIAKIHSKKMKKILMNIQSNKMMMCPFNKKIIIINKFSKIDRLKITLKKVNLVTLMEIMLILEGLMIELIFIFHQ